MSGHLPECTYDFITRNGDPWCICSALRACEARVRGELPPNGADATWYLLGQRKGLSAARDAVAALPQHWPNSPALHRATALAAIDALRAHHA